MSIESARYAYHHTLQAKANADLAHSAALRDLITAMTPTWLERDRRLRPLADGEIEALRGDGLSESDPRLTKTPYAHARLIRSHRIVGRSIEITTRERSFALLAEHVDRETVTVERFPLRTTRGKSWAARFGVTP